MLEGLCEVGAALEERGIAFTLQQGDPAEVALKLGRRASLIVCDRGYLAPQKAWCRQVADGASCAVVQVESDVVVPVNTASDKAEFASVDITLETAATLARTPPGCGKGRIAQPPNADCAPGAGLAEAEGLSSDAKS